MNSVLSKAHLATLCLLLAGACSAQAANQKELRFDLSKIGFVMNGHQICEDKGRLQDYPSKVMDQIIAAGPTSVPGLIAMLTDERMAKTEEPIICYWPGMAIGDIAFCLLEDLFLNGDWTKATLPGAGWDEMLGPAGDDPSWEQLHRFTRKHGRKELQAKWSGIQKNSVSS